MTAENTRMSKIKLVARHGASMRPRPMTAENARRRGSGRARSPGFNEAAADDRGKLIGR